MAQVTISGHSDDIIQIEGDIVDEFYPGRDREEPYHLAFSDGTVLTVFYDNDGVWRLFQKKRGRTEFAKTEGDEDSGTDTVTLTGDVDWVLGGQAFARAK